jgi:glutamate 5-kinase
MNLPKRIVIKLGTRVLTSGIGQLDTARIEAICRQVAALRSAGTEVVVVSSGAVGLGMGRLGLNRRPKEITKRQACAAVGQSLLMQTWQRAFEPHAITVAQVLLTHEDLRVRARHLGVKDTLRQLIGYGTVPIINENDTVSASEIQFGDNDTLSAMVAVLLEADHLVILSMAPGLVDLKGSGTIVPVVERITPEIEAMAGGTDDPTGTGGMISKVSAAKLATRSGCGVFIASGAESDVLSRLFAGAGPSTFFLPNGIRMESRKRWLAWYQRPSGTISVNANAAAALREKGSSLLAVGVTGCSGSFEAGEIVNIAGPDGLVFARGRAAFGSAQIPAIAGRRGEELKAAHPSRKRLEVVHRNDLVLV